MCRADLSGEDPGMTSTFATRRGRVFAAWYPTLMGRIELNGQAIIRRDQLAGAGGRVLEIGAGSGLSVPHYPVDVQELVLVEPNPVFRTRLCELVDGIPFL
jgi:hypothetical protein